MNVDWAALLRAPPIGTAISYSAGVEHGPNARSGRQQMSLALDGTGRLEHRVFGTVRRWRFRIAEADVRRLLAGLAEAGFPGQPPPAPADGPGPPPKVPPLDYVAEVLMVQAAGAYASVDLRAEAGEGYRRAGRVITGILSALVGEPFTTVYATAPVAVLESAPLAAEQVPEGAQSPPSPASRTPAPENGTRCLSELAGECDLCSVRSPFAGKAETRGGMMFTVVRCPSCREEFSFWDKGKEPILKAYLEGRERLRSPEEFDRSWAILLGCDAAAKEAFLLRAKEDASVELPFFRLEELGLSPDRTVAGLAWASLALHHDGFMPEPTRADRIAEALAAAVQFDCLEACLQAVDGLEEYSPAAFEEALLRFPWRMGRAPSAHPLVPLLQALVGRGGDFAGAVDAAAARWTDSPQLVSAVRQARRTRPGEGGARYDNKWFRQ